MKVLTSLLLTTYLIYVSATSSHNHTEATPSPTLINCDDTDSYDYYAGCMLRDDIDSKTQIIFSIFFVICLLIFGKSVWNLITIFRIQRRTPADNMKTMNLIICVFAITQLGFYSDGPLQLFAKTNVPLSWYQYLESLSVLLLNIALCNGGYFWINTIFSVTLNNMYKTIVSGIYSCLHIFNFLFFVYYTMAYFYKTVNDEDPFSEVGIAVTKVPPLITAVSTGMNGLFFSLGCLILRRYLANNWEKIAKEEGKVLARLAIIGVCIAAVRILQNVIEGIWQLPEGIKRDTVTGKTWPWAWAVYGAVYLALVNLLPSLYFLMKYAPKYSEKYDDEGSFQSNAGSLLIKIIRASEGITSDRDLFMRSDLLVDPEEAPMKRSLIR